MNPRPFNFTKTGFHLVWSTITQWRWVKIALFAIFLIWVKDGTVDPATVRLIAVALTATLAGASLLDAILLILPAKTMAKLTRTRDEQRSWDALGAMEAKR
jgi:hypothetical protein